MSDFAERLQLAIKQAGSNPLKVAKAVNVTAQATQKWKKGQISVDTLINVIKEIGVDANWLLLGGGKPTKTKSTTNTAISVVRSVNRW